VVPGGVILKIRGIKFEILRQNEHGKWCSSRTKTCHLKIGGNCKFSASGSDYQQNENYSLIQKIHALKEDGVIILLKPQAYEVVKGNEAEHCGEMRMNPRI